MNFSTVGALADSQLSIYDYGRKAYRRGEVVPPSTLLDVVELANKFELGTIWIVPDSRLSQLAGESIANLTMQDEIGVRASSNRNGSVNYCHAWKTGGSYLERRTIKIGFPEWDPRWGEWAEITNPGVMLRTILYLQDALGIEIDWSPGYTSQQLLKSLNTGNRSTWLRPANVPEEMKDTTNFAKDLRVHRALKESEKRPGRFLHIFDKNSQYLAAATGANMGEGEPEYQDHFDAVDPRLPGLWQVQMHESINTSWLAEMYQGREWLWTPEYIYLEQKGYILGTGACYFWPKGRYHETLRTWAETLWTARQNLKQNAKPVMRDGCIVSGSKYGLTEAREASYSAVKLIATQGLGWLAHEPRHGDSSQYYRPDMWNMTVATAVQKLLMKIQQLAASGMSVCYVEVDAIGAISDLENPMEAFPSLYDRLGNLGAFKHAATIAVDADLATLFEDVTKKGHTALHRYILSQERKELSHAL